MHTLSSSHSSSRPFGRATGRFAAHRSRATRSLLLAGSLAFAASSSALAQTGDTTAPPPAQLAPAPTEQPAAESVEQPATTPPPTAAATPEPEPTPTTPAESAPPPSKPTPPPYSLPWQLRPAVAATVLRSDTSFASYENIKSHKSGFTVASMLLGSYKLTDSFAPMIRLGLVSNSPPAGLTTTPVPPATAGKPIDSGFELINPVVGGTYALKLGSDFKFAAFVGATIPIGTGGGDKPAPADSEAVTRGLWARSAMDNAMFAVNYFTIFPGVDFAYVAHGLTLQVEATLFQLERVRGDKNAANKDADRTNFTTGIHAGYFFIPQLSAGVELRHQRWLSTPSTIKGAKTPYTEDTLRDTTTFAFGLRGHVKLGDKIWLRPGLSYALPLDNPMAKQKYGIVQLDIPVIF